MSTPAVWKTVVWERLNDAGKWYPYSGEVGHLLEQSYKKTLNTVKLGDVDVTLKTYVVNLKDLVQISEVTGMCSPVRRHLSEEGSAVAKSIMWQWCVDRHGIWHSYDTDVINYIEDAYNKGLEVIDLNEKFPDYYYCVDFHKMQQINKKTKYRRSVRRVTVSPFPVVKCNEESKGACFAGMAQNNDVIMNSVDAAASTGESTESNESKSPNKKDLLKQVSMLWNKLKKPVDNTVDSLGGNSPTILSKKQKCTTKNSIKENISKPSKKSPPYVSGVNEGYLADASPEMETSTSDASSAKHSTYAIVNGKPWRNSWLPDITRVKIRPVPGINLPRNLKKKSGRKKGTTKVEISEHDMINEFTEELLILPSTSEEQVCIICYDTLGVGSSYDGDNTVVKLKMCSHIFHKSCLKAMYNSGTKDGHLQCPTCKTIHGEKGGTQPPGIMDFHILPYSLPGHSDCDTIHIIYDIPCGIQGPEHPNPGRRFTARGFPRHCFLPDSEQGRKVLKLLVKAWERRLIFTIGSSSTTGEEDTVTWNEIHHKTEFGANKYGHGFPDPNYLDNIILELATHGVTDS